MTLKILVGTRFLREFTGSEIIAREVAQHFAARGHTVTLVCAKHTAPMADLAGDFTVTTDIDSLDLADFDLVWSQHHMLLQIPSSLESCVRRRQVPKIVAVSLSPFEFAEHLDGIIARALGAEIWANSDETAAHVASGSRRIIPRRSIHVLGNAAPDAFWEPPLDAPAEKLRKIVFVSNHFPREVLDAAAELEQQGIEVRIVGTEHERILVDRDVLREADAVVTIGKTVVDAIATGRPAYVYDRFGGAGWLSESNFARNRSHNFSGRPEERRLSGTHIAAEVIAGYADARAYAQTLRGEVSGLRLSEHLDALLERTPRHHRRWRSYVLALHFIPRRFRAHLETVRRLMSAQF